MQGMMLATVQGHPQVELGYTPGELEASRDARQGGREIREYAARYVLSMRSDEWSLVPRRYCSDTMTMWCESRVA